MAKPRMQKTKYQGVFMYPGARGGKCYYVTYHNDGKMVWEKIGWDHEGITSELARDKRAQIYAQIRVGELLPKGKEGPTVGDGFVTYFEYLKRERKPKLYVDQTVYNKWLKDTIGNIKMNKLEPTGIDRLREKQWDLAGKEVARNCIGLIRRMYNYNIKKGKYHGSNPILKVDMPKERKFVKRKYYTDEELGRIFTELKKRSEPMWEIATVAVNTGARKGEILNLKGDDVDLDNELIRIAATKDGHNDRDRYVSISGPVLEILKTKDLRPGKPIFPAWSQNPWLAALKASGVNEGVTDTAYIGNFHTLRHTFASRLAMDGKSLLEIAECLGHTTTNLVKRYSHLSKTAVLKAAKDVAYTPPNMAKERHLKIVGGKSL